MLFDSFSCKIVYICSGDTFATLIRGLMSSFIHCLNEQELLVSVDMEGAMESAGGSLFVGALSAQTSLF